MNVEFNSREALSFGWDAISDRIEFFLGTYLVYALVLLIHGIFLVLTVVFAANASYGLAVIFGIITWVLGAIVYAAIFTGYIKTSLLLVDKEDFGIADLRPTLGQLWKVIVGGILYFTIVGIGLLLFIVPGIIWAIKYYPFGWLIIDQDLGIIDAFEKSSEITQGHKGELFRFFFSCGLVLLGGALLCLIGLVIAFPVVLAANAHVYRELSGTEVPESYEAEAAAPQGV